MKMYPIYATFTTDAFITYTYHNKCKINCIPYKLKKKPAILKYYYINNTILYL